MTSLGYSQLHHWHHDDYEIAKRHIWEQVGDISESMVFGSQVLCAIYIRPSRNPNTGLEHTDTHQLEDVHQGKSMMILACGPSAFKGSAEDLAAIYGEAGPPKINDWVFARANMGEPLQMKGEGALRVTVKDRRGDDQMAYPFEGWPCRILQESDLIGRVAKPHQVV